MSAASFEEGIKCNSTSIQNLSTLIDLYCLYDKLAVIEDPSSNQVMKRHGALFDLLRSEKAIIELSVSDELHLELVNNAERRLSVFFRGEECHQPEGMLHEPLTPDSIKHQFESFPFEPERQDHLEVGKKWWKQTATDMRNTHGEVRRSALFVARTFYYLAYANVSQCTFTPDALRSALVPPLLQQERLFIDELISALKTSYKPHGISRNLETIISPLSVIVFERARKRETVVSEMKGLREELKNARQQLRELEFEALAKGIKQSAQAKKKWHKLLRQIDNTFSEGCPSVDFSRAADLTETAASVIADPVNFEKWFKLLKKPIEVIDRIRHRGPLIAVHRLYPQLGGAERVERAIHRLFGGLTCN